MYCSQCAAEIPDDANFCYKCAHSVTISFNSQNTHVRQVQPLSNQNNKKSKSVDQEIAAFVLALVIFSGLIIGGLALISNYADEQNRQKDKININVSDGRMTNAEQPTPAPNKKPKVRKTIEQPAEETVYKDTNAAAPAFSQPQTIVNETFAVKAGTYTYYNFTLNSSSRIVGRVEASGGNDDIDTIILDADEFTNFRNTGRYRSYFHSGYVTIGNIDFNLAAGSYYVIFSNSAALFTNKVVKAKVEIQ